MSVLRPAASLLVGVPLFPVASGRPVFVGQEIVEWNNGVRGGAECQFNFNCGSETTNGGQCVIPEGQDRGTCECFPGYHCPYCSQLESEEECLDIPPPVFAPVGGGECEGPEECYAAGGQCINGHCACYDQWFCLDCSLSNLDLLNGHVCPIVPTFAPTPVPSPSPTPSPSYSPTAIPTATPSLSPTASPTVAPPPTFPSGGDCTTDIDCYERGICVDNKCQCNSGWTCPDCSLTIQEYLDAGRTCPPPLEIPVGGADCVDATGQGNNFYCYEHGRCQNEACSCLPGWACADCQHRLQDILSGDEICNEDRVLPEVGGHPCSVDADCLNYGRCKSGICGCNAGRVCPDCSATDQDVFDGVASCPTPPGLGDIEVGGGECEMTVECSGHGNCVGEQCSCNAGYVCSHCSLDVDDFIEGITQCPVHSPPPAGGMPCSSNSQCIVGRCTNGSCQCNSGWVCEDCSLSANDYWLEGEECSSSVVQLPAGEYTLTPS